MNSWDLGPSQSRTLVQGFIQRVYQWMAAGLAVTGAVAYAASGNMEFMKALYGGLIWVLILAELGLVIWLTSQAMRLSAAAATTGFLIYSALNGLNLAFIFLVYTHASIGTVFFLAAATFAGVSLYGWTLKEDLSSLRSFLVMGLLGLILASVVNIFLRSSALDWILSYVGVGLFIGLTAYDTQKLKAIHASDPEARESLAVVGALTLYLDFINLFLFLLRIFGRRR